MANALTILIELSVSAIIDVIPANCSWVLAALLLMLRAIPKMIIPLKGTTVNAIPANFGLMIKSNVKNVKILIGSINYFLKLVDNDFFIFSISLTRIDVNLPDLFLLK